MVTVRYLVDDLETSVSFYTQFLGFELRQQFGPAMAILQKDELSLWLAGPMSSAAKPMPSGNKPKPGGGWGRFVLEVEQLSELVLELKSQGVRFRNEILQGPGGSQILCEDPSGNLIELFEAK